MASKTADRINQSENLTKMKTKMHSSCFVIRLCGVDVPSSEIWIECKSFIGTRVKIGYGRQVAHYSCHRSRIAYLRNFQRWFWYGRVTFDIFFASFARSTHHNYTNGPFNSSPWRKKLQYLRRMALIAFRNNKKFNLAAAINCWTVCLDLKSWKMLFSF